jgi:Fe-S cluster assembly ATP-binding protein
MLEIKDLSVSIENKEILHDINLVIKTGETHVLFGPNGAGKSTLLSAIMGFPKYQITKGSIIFHGQDVTHLPMDERARLGIGMSFQRPPVIRGVKTYDMVGACLKGHGGGETVEQLAEKADLADFLERDINYGFSGGEIKRSDAVAGPAARAGFAG